ncbi:MAG: hypothetical protein ABI921_13685, partial [Panacibacter sp.]
NINALPANEFLVKYTGVLHVNEAGEYNFNLNTFGGGGVLKISNASIISFTNWRSKGKVKLPAGDLPFELVYSKYVDWAKPSVGLNISGPGVREFTISDPDVNSADDADPVMVSATENTILRSFMDLPAGKRVTHAINVGSTERIHYTYDMDNGTIVQLWRGGFLDATSMWHERGDGSSRPAGMVVYFGKPMLFIEKLSDANAGWQPDTAGTAFTPKGYILDEKDRPSFKYKIYGAAVTDAIRVLENGKGIHREISIGNGTSGMYLRLAEANSIEEISNGFYLIDDKTYYLKIDDAANAKPAIRDMSGRKELIIPIENKLGYSILF